MPAKQPKRKTSGAENLKAAGKSGFLIGLTPEEKHLIRVAAAVVGQSMSEFIVISAVKAAEKKFPKS